MIADGGTTLRYEESPKRERFQEQNPEAFSFKVLSDGIVRRVSPTNAATLRRTNNRNFVQSGFRKIGFFKMGNLK